MKKKKEEKREDKKNVWKIKDNKKYKNNKIPIVIYSRLIFLFYCKILFST